MKSSATLGRPGGAARSGTGATARLEARLQIRPAEKSKRRLSRASVTSNPTSSKTGDFDQLMREGYTEKNFVQKQADKGRVTGNRGTALRQGLGEWDVQKTADVAVVGCGPAGMALAAETAKLGLRTVLIGEDVPFVNNYGVWVDEFEEAGLTDTLANVWPQAVCYFGEEEEVIIDRQYGRVDLDKLRQVLLERCQQFQVAFHSGFVEHIDTENDPTEAHIKCQGTSDIIKSKMVTLASGAAAGKFLKFESDAPSPGAQTAYGMEVELEGYSERYPGDKMLFMDYRRHHSGIWPGTAPRIKKGQHPDGGDGLWSSHGETPTFLYAMPLSPNRVFLEETCLVAKTPLPFASLKRRLERRIEAMGLDVKEVHDEEWSYIPVGGPLPIEDQGVTAFGSAANLIHPASGYSVSRSLREAPAMAKAIQTALATNRNVPEMSKHVWSALWTTEKKTQAAFHVFGMELLAQLELPQINEFFITFFKLPPFYWKGFLSTSISSVDLLIFAIITFIIAQPSIKFRLISHLLSDPSGGYMLLRYFNKYSGEIQRLIEAEKKSEN